LPAIGYLPPLCFNPPPAVRPGGTQCRPRCKWVAKMFQSAPGGEAGGNRFIQEHHNKHAGFNPPPAVRPGGTLLNDRQCRLQPVSIRPRR